MSKTNDKELVDELWNSNKNLIILVLAKMWKNQPDIQNMAKIFDIIKTKIPDLKYLISLKLKFLTL